MTRVFIGFMLISIATLVWLTLAPPAPVAVGVRAALLGVLAVVSIGGFALVRSIRTASDPFTRQSGVEAAGVIVELDKGSGKLTGVALLTRVTLNVLHPDGSVYRAVAVQPMTHVTFDSLAPGDAVPVRIHSRHRNQVTVDVEKLGQLHDQRLS